MKHGVDLLGRDHALLGRVLAALAGFAEAAAGSTAVTPLAGATLELIRAPQVGPWARGVNYCAARGWVGRWVFSERESGGSEAGAGCMHGCAGGTLGGARVESESQGGYLSRST